MYNYINGTIDQINSNSVVIDNNGIGYNIFVANPYCYELGKTYKIYTYHHMSEYDIALYGFKTIEEKDLFLKLINVKGLGPKVALPMFAESTVEGIMDAIERENIIYLTKFPKVGEKLARQIILDLKGKLAKTKEESLGSSSELVEALESLGYKTADIKKAIAKVDLSDSIENQIKSALKIMMK